MSRSRMKRLAALEAGLAGESTIEDALKLLADEERAERAGADPETFAELERRANDIEARLSPALRRALEAMEADEAARAPLA